MNSVDKTVSTTPEETKSDSELTLDELETVSAGNRVVRRVPSAGEGNNFLRFDFQNVSVKTISWGHDD